MNFQSNNFVIFIIDWLIVFLGLHPWHMEVPGLGVESELYLPAYTATAAPDPSRVCDLYHSSWQCRILKPLSKARDWTSILVDTSQVHYHWAPMGIPIFFNFDFSILKFYNAVSCSGLFPFIIMNTQWALSVWKRCASVLEKVCELFLLLISSHFLCSVSRFHGLVPLIFLFSACSIFHSFTFFAPLSIIFPQLYLPKFFIEFISTVIF